MAESNRDRAAGDAGRPSTVDQDVENLREQEAAFREKAADRKKKGNRQRIGSFVTTYGGAAVGAASGGAALMGQAGVSTETAAAILLGGSLFAALAGAVDLSGKAVRNLRSSRAYEVLADKAKRGARDVQGADARKLHDELEDTENALEEARLATP